MKFQLKEEHIKLLSNAYITWNNCEYGSPQVDCKRPYGNSSVLYDMVKILNIELEEDKYGEVIIPSKVAEQLDTLHFETGTALQIILVTQSFKTGMYENIGYGNEWVFIG